MPARAMCLASAKRIWVMARQPGAAGRESRRVWLLGLRAFLAGEGTKAQADDWANCGWPISTAPQYDEERSVYDAGPLIRHIADGDFAFFSTWVRLELDQTLVMIEVSLGDLIASKAR